MSDCIVKVSHVDAAAAVLPPALVHLHETEQNRGRGTELRLRNARGKSGKGGRQGEGGGREQVGRERADGQGGA
eukprot:scaffold201785_cov29-Tisochrysis_lutea.AAC.5